MLLPYCALVGGSTQGIGRAVAEALAEAGATVTLIARREAALRVAPDGAVRWADERAERLLGLHEGADLLPAMLPGSEDKARRLLLAAATAPVHDWELQLRGRDGTPQTVRCAAALADDETDTGELALLVSLVADADVRRMGEMSETMEG